MHTLAQTAEYNPFALISTTPMRAYTSDLLNSTIFPFISAERLK
jgi:hypothetical protein